MNPIFASRSRPLFALDGDALTEQLGGSGRARAVWSALRAGIDPFVDARVPKGARRRLTDACTPTTLSEGAVHVAADETIKLLFELEDRRAIEAVLIPNDRGPGRTTLCVSTQVGCARGCTFCLTATMKLVRNLSAAEIVAQVAAAIRISKARALPPLRNIVFMGMGEPLDNFEETRAALARITDSQCGLGFGPSRVTLSTVGPSPKQILAARELPARIAWSLHAADDAVRAKLIPTTKHSVVELAHAFRELMRAREEPLFVEMTMIDGVNDGDDDADKAIALFADFEHEVRFNLLPMNPIGGEQKPSNADRLRTFEAKLRAAGRFTMVRRARGETERAACGQLAVTLTKLPRGRSDATTTPQSA